ncbi:hypothetical protein SDC9_62663 [bioreactor metagenome]|uniref:Uncharacterized protein n=1 Tax=bioreactor metagenome TaxID=1076179 RepID=A0A644XJD1_9ZZZZ
MAPCATHHQLELALLLVVHEQLARHRALIAQHVDQEAQCAQAVAKLVEHQGTLFLGHAAHNQTFHRIAHVHHGVRGLIEAQHRQHAAHLAQTARHVVQHGHIFRRAEELVHGFFRIRQRGTQLVHHAAHRLMVAHAAVQLFHPRFERGGLTTRHYLVQAFGQAQGAFAHMVLRHVQFFERGLQIQHGGGHFHGQRWRRGLARLRGLVDGALQGDSQRLAVWMQLAQ